MKQLFFIVLTLFVTPASLAAEMVIDFELSPTGNFSAKTSKVKGGAILDGENLKLDGERVLVLMKGLETGIKLRDEHLAEKLDVKKNPVAKMTNISGKDGEGKGLLEYRNFNKEVKFEYKLASDKKTVTAEFELDITEFGLQDEIRYMGVGVEDEVKVKITLPVKEAKK